MPALKPVSKVIRVRLIGTEVGGPSVGSHFTLSYSGTGPTVAQLGTFATAVGTAWATSLAPITPSAFTLSRVEVVDLTSPTAGAVEQTVTHAGTRTGPALPLNSAFSLRFVTQLRRRGGHWHIQLRAGVQTDAATTSDWVSTFPGVVTTAWSSFLGATEGSVWPGGGTLGHVGVQYYGPPNKQVTNSTGRVRTVSTPLDVPVTYAVTSYGGGLRIGSARRRLGKQSG